MNRQTWQRPFVAGLAVLAGLVILQVGWAQRAEPEDVIIANPGPGPGGPSRVPLNEPPDVIKLKHGTAAIAVDGAVRKVMALQVRPDRMHEIRDAAKALNEAEGDEAKEAAESRLNELLNDYFDEDMKRR
jgi:hypothetical protein